MQKFDSLSSFLRTGGFNHLFFDMGRKVCQIPNDRFEMIESQQQVYPYPFQQKAWLAVLLWQDPVKRSSNKVNADQEARAIIWFLQFPIDELGFLKLEARDAFLIDLLEQTSKNIQARQVGETLQDELKESPFAFKPQQEKLAIFHAFATQALGESPSQFYQPTRDYLSGKTGFEQWYFLGLQGIADVVVRLDEDNNEKLMSEAIKKLPAIPAKNFLQMLEHVELPSELTKVLVSRLDAILADSPANSIKNKELNKQNVALVALLLRAMSGAQNTQVRNQVLSKVLDSEYANDIEILAAISGRAWKGLMLNQNVERFIDRLSLQNQSAFNAILLDLVMIPGMRDLILNTMRNPERSTLLGEKFSGFLHELVVRE